MRILQFIRDNIWSELPREVTPRQRITAGLAWGGALILFGAILLWNRARHAQPAGADASVLIAFGLLLAALLLLPTGPAVYAGIMRAVSIVGFVMTNLILALAFYLIVTPMGWLLKISGKDLLERRKGLAPAWKRPSGRTEKKRYYRMS